MSRTIRFARGSVLAVFATVGLVACGSSPDPSPSEPAFHFSDPALQECVEEALSIVTSDSAVATGTPTPTMSETPSNASTTPAELETLVKLACPDYGIVSLDGLEAAIQLQQLDLSNNQIVDLSPLSSLTNLETLELGSNSISEVSSLARLVNLNELGLSENQIANVSPLSNLNKLKWLDLHRNLVVDVSPLQSLTQLRYLHLDDNRITDCSPLSGFSGNVRISFGGNSCSWNDYVDPGSYSGSEEPEDVGEGITFSDPDFELCVRDELGISGRTITPARMESLTELSCPTIGIDSLGGLEYAVNLTTLRIFSNRCVDWSWPTNNSIVDISPLAGLTQLTYLDLACNRIVDVSPLADLTNLTHLDLFLNEIQDVTPLSNLVNLTWLDLRQNPIVEYFPLESLVNLIWFNGSDISDITEASWW